MTAFSYTSGNITNLAAGQNALMSDIQGSLVDLRTFLNGGTMDETNVPNLAAAFTSYERLQRVGGSLGVSAAGTYLLQAGSWTASSIAVGATTAFAKDHLIYLDPTLYAANSRVTKLNLRYLVSTNAVAPTPTYTAGLYPVTAVTATSGGDPFVSTVGTVISGSTAQVVAPAANSVAVTATSGDFNFPAAGAYVVAVVLGPGSTAAGALTSHIVQIDMRRV